MSTFDGNAFDPAVISANPRAQRGFQIAAVAPIRRVGSAWSVPSQTGNGRYTVSDGACSCPDFEERGGKCKHQWAVEFVLKRETAPDGTVTETKAVRVTYGQDWPRYNRAQVEEGHELPRLLAGLCSLVEQPEQHRGRPRASLADMTFAATMKVYRGFSSRRVSSALAEAEADGLIARAPAYNTLNDYLADPALTPVFKELIRASSLPLAAIETQFAIDSTGFAGSRFDRWYLKKYEHAIDHRTWVKLHIVCGTATQIVTSAEVTDWRQQDSPQFVPLLRDTPLAFDVREVSADKAYLSRNNVAAVEFVGARPFIPFKVNTRPQTGFNAWGRMYHLFAFNREEFLAHYHRRSQVESTFSAMKRKFGDGLRTKTFTANCNEALAKVLCHNLTVVVRAMHEFGIQADFGGER